MLYSLSSLPVLSCYTVCLRCPFYHVVQSVYIARFTADACGRKGGGGGGPGLPHRNLVQFHIADRLKEEKW